MSFEIVVVAFVAVAFVAIVWRFLPRSESGAVLMPTVVDRSIAMWLVRRALRRPLGWPESAEPIPVAEPDEEEIAFRIGVPGAPPPTVPTRFVVSQAPYKVEPSIRTTRSHVAALSHVAADGSVGPPPARRPSGALATQRRWAGAVALAVVAITVTTMALASRQLEGEVLSATGMPGDSPIGGYVGGETAVPSGGSPNPGLSSDLPAPPSASAATDARTAATAPTPAPGAPQPTRTPRATTRPTATPHRSPAPKPAPTSAIPPSAAPTPEPSPSPAPSAPASP
jgi:hypothetical protein